MDNALIQVGLPVKCAYADCEAHAYIKPATNHDGWKRRKTIMRSTWYCPDHADTVAWFNSVPLGSVAGEPKDPLNELMDLI